MADTCSDQEDRIEEALDAIHDGHFISASAAARHFNLKPPRVQYRLRGRLQERLAHNFTNALRMLKNRLFVTKLII